MYGKPNVKLLGYSRGLDSDLGPEDISAFSAMGCFSKYSSFEIIRNEEVKREILWENKYIKDKYKSKDEIKVDVEIEEYKKIVLKESAGRGHGSVLDQNYFTYSIENLPRAATLFICGPENLAHEQQSLRRATADRGFYLPPEIEESVLFQKTKKVLSDSFSFYEKAVEAEVPKEDARYPLPLYTKTNIVTSSNARELMHTRKMAQQESVPSIVKYTVDEMLREAEKIAPNLFLDTGYNYETLAWRPSSQIFGAGNITINDIARKLDYPNHVVLLSYSGIEMNEKQIRKAVEERDENELSNLKHVHFDFLVPMSLACFHQATRQRTWSHSVEPVYDAAKRKQIVTPPKIKNSAVFDDYKKQNEAMFELYDELSENGILRREAAGILPHSMQIYDLIHVDGWNAVHSIGKRTCSTAQWEIRDYSKQMTSYIKEKNPSLGKFAEPQCMTYNKCPERNPCGYFESHKIS